MKIELQIQNAVVDGRALNTPFPKITQSAREPLDRVDYDAMVISPPATCNSLSGYLRRELSIGENKNRQAVSKCDIKMVALTHAKILSM